MFNFHLLINYVIFFIYIITANELKSSFTFDELLNFTNILNNNMKDKQKDRFEGNIANNNIQVTSYYNLTHKYMPSIICEIGFNAGHSAATLLFGTHIDAKYLAFDLGHLPSNFEPNKYNHGKHFYTNSSKDLINNYFKNNNKVELIIGDSTDTVPNFVNNNKDFKCDLISVDGGHFGLTPIFDLINMYSLAKDDNSTIVLLDDATCKISKNKRLTTGCHKPELAWNALVQMNAIINPYCHTLSITRGFCHGNYNFNNKLKNSLSKYKEDLITKNLKYLKIIKEKKNEKENKKNEKKSNN
jgi:hypothetical protein